MNEPNHELSDSEAQAFQAEPHLQDLMKRLNRPAPAPSSPPAPPAEEPGAARRD